MSTNKTWVIKEDGDILYRFLSSKDLEAALELFKVAFYPDENVCKAVNLSKNPKAVSEVLELKRSMAKEGISVVAIDTNTDKIVGVGFNKILEKASAGDNFPDLTQPESIAALQTILEVSNACDIYELCDTSCVFEIALLATSAQYRGRGIAGKLCEAGLEIAKRLYDGENVKRFDENEKIPLGPKPEAVTSLFTSIRTQKIGRKLKFEIATRKSYEQFTYQGRTYASVIGNETKNITYEYKKLK